MLGKLLLLGVCLGSIAGQDTLQAVDDAELAKLAQEEKFVVALLCTEENAERCEEFEGELTSIREDVIDSLEDGWVVKSVDGTLWQHFAFSNKQPMVVFLRGGQPVLYDGGLQSLPQGDPHPCEYQPNEKCMFEHNSLIVNQ